MTCLPLPYSDSIFAVLIEELGAIGAFGLIGLYGLFMWRGLRIAKNAPDLFGSVMAAGLTFWVVIEAALNMLSIVGRLPLLGNTLPFFSYGGSSLVSILAAVGIIFSISRSTGKPVREKVEQRSYSATADLRRRDRRRRVPRAHRA
jgi:cell division protein FtsW